MRHDGQYDLAALDMDGTLLNTAHETTPFTRRALSRAAEAGKVIALCTGRCLSELTYHLETLPGVAYAISENGGCLYDAKAKRVLHQVAIPRDVAGRVLALAAKRDVCVQCFIGGQSCMQLGDTEELRRYHIYDYAGIFEAGSIFTRDMAALWRERGAEMEKINLYFASEGERATFREELGEVDLYMSDSLGIGYEISPTEATKARGLEALCRLLDIPVERSMAVGDGGNDVELMRAAGFSVAMGNATDAVRRAADAVTDDCDHDGAARAVLKYLLGEAQKMGTKFCRNTLQIPFFVL